MASLAGSKKTPAVAIAKLSTNTAGSERVATKGTASDEDRAEQVDGDHEPALVEPVDDDAGKGAEEHVGEACRARTRRRSRAPSPWSVYTSHGNASAASRSPIWETNWPAQSSRKLALRYSGAS